MFGPTGSEVNSVFNYFFKLKCGNPFQERESTYNIMSLF